MGPSGPILISKTFYNTESKDRSQQEYYIISRAFTKEVVTNGRVSVSHSLWVQIMNTSRAVEPKKANNQSPLYFFPCSIL